MRLASRRCLSRRAICKAASRRKDRLMSGFVRGPRRHGFLGDPLVGLRAAHRRLPRPTSLKRPNELSTNSCSRHMRKRPAEDCSALHASALHTNVVFSAFACVHTVFCCTPAGLRIPPAAPVQATAFPSLSIPLPGFRTIASRAVMMGLRKGRYAKPELGPDLLPLRPLVQDDPCGVHRGQFRNRVGPLSDRHMHESPRACVGYTTTWAVRRIGRQCEGRAHAP